ncbi:MAG: hypothetical protein IIC22_07800 [Chloroflexi bacterium]|nr:hypothetical protein [Chloroflexota bacterium]
MNTPARPPTIVVLGGINMDLIAVAPKLPTAGETVVGDSFYTTAGGKGANQAVAAAKLGANVRMVGRVGKDSFGPTLLDGLRGHNIDVSGVAEDPDNASGIAMILLDAQRQCQNAHSQGTTDDLQHVELPEGIDERHED